MMAADEDYQEDSSGSSRYMPRSPDPTTLTSAAVERATGVFRREVQNLREIIETRLTAMDAAAGVAVQDRDRLAAALLEKQDARFTAEREYLLARLDAYVVQARERFDRVQDQFAASRIAIDAAFAAAKEAVDQQNKANTLAIDKSDTATAESLTALRSVTDAGIAGLEDKISDARDRITRIESLTQGIEKAGGEQRQERGLQHSGVQIALFAFAILISVVSVIVAVISLVHK